MLDYSLPVAKRTRRGQQELLSKSTKVMCQVTTTSSDSTNSRDKPDTSLSLDDDDDDDDDDYDYDGVKEEVEMEGSQSDSEEEFYDIVEEGSNGEEVKKKVKSKRVEDEGFGLIGKDVEERSSAKSKNDQKMKKEIVLEEENDGFEIVQEPEGKNSDNEDEDEDEDESSSAKSKNDQKMEMNSDNMECVDLTLNDDDYDDDMDSGDEVHLRGRKRKQPKRKKPDSNRNQNQVIDCVAKRTRSNMDPDYANKITSHGTSCSPHYVYVEPKPGFGDKDKHCAMKTKSSTEKMDSEKVESDGEEYIDLTKEDVRKHVPTTQRVLKFLADSLLDGAGEMPFDETDLPTIIREEVLQYKFFFGEEEEIVAVKSYAEQEVDDLFAQMDFALKCSEIGSVDYANVEDDNKTSLPDELDQECPSHQGKHVLKLDEEIGLVCKFCGHVELEIRYIMPAFGSNSRKRTDYIYDSREDNSLFDDFVNPDLGFQPELFNSFNYEEGTAWDLIPAGTMQSMYPHQREGFKFLWNNVAGAFHLEKLKNPETKNCGSGCIISHVPGTGKSRLTLVFLQSYMRRFPNCMPVIVAPRSMLLTWEEEFKKWKVDIPFHILNIPDLSGYDSVYRATKDPRVVRLIKLLSWKKHKSVLGISYKLFERLTGDDNKKGHKDFYEYEKIKTLLLDTPDLFIFDEGHTPRNERSQMFQALFQIKTEKRIILSGTPFQNNFKELYNTLRLVRPSFTDKMLAKNGEVQKKRGPKSSESKQKWISLTDNIIHSGSQLQNPSIEELRATIAPFVHIHKGNILKQSLQGLRHAVLILQPGNIQKNLLDIVEGPKYALKDDCAVSLLSVHPSLLQDSINKQALVGKYKLQDLRLKPEAGVKTWFLMELLQLSEALKEKVLVFGQYIEALTCIKDQLEFHRKWTEGREILYMDGKSEARKRQSYINLFNDPKSEARIMLASIKSCGEGISLIGASRVVLLDVLWNPSAERQAISRAYRIGQKKVVYVYRLITSGTMEEGKWSRQAEKDRLSKLVFSSSSEMCGENHEQEMSRLWEDTILDEMVNHEKLEKMFKGIIYQKQPNESDILESTE